MRKLTDNFRRLLWLYKFYWKYDKRYTIMSILFWSAVIPLARYLLVIFPQLVIDGIENGKSLASMIWLVIWIQGAICLLPLADDIYRFVLSDVGKAKVEIGIKKEIYKKALYTDYKYVDKPDFYNNYQWAIKNQSDKSQESFDLLNNTLSSLAVIITMIGLIVQFNIIIVIITVISMVLRSFGYIKYYENEFCRQKDIMPIDRKRDYINRIFHLREYAEDLKSTRLSEYMFAMYDAESEKKLSTIRSYIKKLLSWSMFSNLIYRVVMASVIIYIIYEIYSGDIPSASSYLTIILAVEQLDNYMMTLFNLVQQGNKLGMETEPIMQYYQMESYIEPKKEALRANKQDQYRAFALDFENVSFGYDEKKTIINNMSFHIHAGEKIGIVGENGVGKSTLVKLILRLYDPDEGSIFLNGNDLKKSSLSEVRDRIGVVFQQPHVYAMPIKDNVRLYRQDVDDEQIVSTLKDLRLDRLIQDGISTEMTREFQEQGIITSGGETQKVGLARIIGNMFSLLILDEPSSALDPIAEQEMTDLLLSRCDQTTTIMIAHRLSTIKEMDRIMLISDGAIVEEGTHDELMKLRGKYYQMWNKQAEKYRT